MERITSSLEAGSEIAIIADMRTLHIAQTQFMMKNERYGTLEELKGAGLVDASFAEGKRHGYVITFVSADARSFAFRADPDPESKLFLRHFYIDQTGVTRANHTKPAGPNDPTAM